MELAVVLAACIAFVVFAACLVTWIATGADWPPWRRKRGR